MIKIPDCMIVNTFLPNNFFAYNNILQIIFAPILTFFTTNTDGIYVVDSFCGFQKIKLSRAQRKSLKTLECCSKCSDRKVCYLHFVSFLENHFYHRALLRITIMDYRSKLLFFPGKTGIQIF